MSQSHRYFTVVCLFSILAFTSFWRDFWGAFHSTQNSGNFGSYIKWNGPFRFGPTEIFGTSFEGGTLWPVWSFRSVGPKCPPFPFDKRVAPSPALLCPAYKNNNQTCGGLGRVCATGMYRSIVKFPKCWMESAHGIRRKREKFESNRSLCPSTKICICFKLEMWFFFFRFGLLSAHI